MITLVTGGPGTGKTAWLISQLLEIRKAQPYREFFIHGIRDFIGFKHTTVYCQSPLCDLCQSKPVEYEIDEAGIKKEVPRLLLEEWPKWYKSHFLIVADEVQRIWGTKLLSSNVDAVSRLQTHRHYGLDFWLVSQSPKLVHTDVKAMVGRHIHLVAKWSGRKQFEWPENRDNINSRVDAVERPYKLPKSVFKLYSSAEVHTKQEKRVPLSLYATAIAIVVALVCSYFVFNRINSRLDGSSSALLTQGGVHNANTSLGVSSSSSPVPEKSDSEKIIDQMRPAIQGMPWTAPIYKELAVPVSFPQIKGCIKSNNFQKPKCTCYTQQATIVSVPAAVCLQYVEHRSFNHFTPDLNSNTVQNDQNSVTMVSADSTKK